MDSELLPARVKDLAYLCEKTNAPKFLGFLTPNESAIAIKQFAKGDKYRLFGGYDGAERVCLCVLPHWCDEVTYPITAFTFKYRMCDTLSHRDFLGALMSLGIARETIGDILVEAGRAVVFVHNDISKFVFTQINKIGNVGVSVTKGFDAPLPQLGIKQEFVTTVASTRLDCVVSAMCGISRKAAAEVIDDGLVCINSICCEKSTHTITSGDTLAVRRNGRFEIVSCDGYSKKGRIILKYNKYV